MNMKLHALCLAAIGGVASLLAPASAEAGNVGYYKDPGCGSAMGDIAAAITTAGHTPVSVPTLDAGSLAPLDGLVIAQGCTPFVANADVNLAVANGLRLFMEEQWVPSNGGAALPGNPALVVNSYQISNLCLLDTNLASGSPIANGPGGVLTDVGLDNGNYCSPMGYATAESLPAGSTPLLTTVNPSQIAAFGYPHGSGYVIFGMGQTFYALPGGIISGAFPQASTYYANTIAVLMDGLAPPVTCASEGYTGTKLEWCKNICERGYTGSTLAMWIRRWTDRYRTLPYCAAAPQPSLR